MRSLSFYKRMQTPLPEKFSNVDAELLVQLAVTVWQAVAHDIVSDAGGIHVDDFVQDCLPNQVQSGMGWNSSYVHASKLDYTDMRWAERMGAEEFAVYMGRRRDAESAGKRRPDDVLPEDLLKALCEFDDPHHDWAIQVCAERMTEFADKEDTLR